MDSTTDDDLTNEVPFDNAPGIDAQKPELPEREKKLVAEIIGRIRDDKRHHEKVFKRMRDDMHVAMWGSEKTWHKDNYRANIVGRHVKMKTAALYAKNPKAAAKRRETLDFTVWDETPASLQLAFQTVQQATVVLQQQQAITEMLPPTVDEMGQPVLPPEPQMPPGAMQAQEVIADFQQGMQRRQMLAKFGKTLEVVYAHQLREQKPLDFKRGMKATVRRALTTGVGYVELGFQREYGPRPGMQEKLADARQRLDHMRNLAEQAAKGEITEFDSEMAELELSILSLEQEPEIIIREGLIVDYPLSTKVIPDRLCKQLDGFVGARRLTVEYSYTVDEVREVFGVDLGDKYTGYSTNPGSQREISDHDVLDDEFEFKTPERQRKGDIVCVWKHFDKASGLVYFVADGYGDFLREPAPPDVYVEGFWPVYALSFNEVENEDELFPPSDVTLLLDMQREHNRSRQGKREHRQAARPRYVVPSGALGDEQDSMRLARLKPFEVLELPMDPAAKVSDIFQNFPVPGVDPNLYDTNEIFADMQLVGGAQEAQYGGVSKSTATESAIAANSTNSSDGSAIDDLDGFLTALARDAGQILKREMSAEQVTEIAGPGAVWPSMSLGDIAKEVDLEIEAGSTGKPNQAVEINNWKQLLPMLMQMPGIVPEWLAKETLRRLDDKLDLTDAIASAIPSIAAMNQQQQMPQPGAEPGQDPNQQGAEGANNAPRPDQEGGSGAAFGSNQV